MAAHPAQTLPAFAPVPRKKEQARGWTPQRQRLFIEALAGTGSVKSAARAVGLSAKSAYDLRRASGAEGFRKAWEAALDIGIQMIEDVAMDRALNGVEEPVFAYGKIIGTRRVYNDQLLMFMLRSRSPRRFAGGGQPRALNGADKFTLAALKKQWREEWDREHALLETEREKATLHQLNAKLDAAKNRQQETDQLMLKPPTENTRTEEDVLANCPMPSKEMRALLPKRKHTAKDDGWEWIDDQ